MKFQITRPDNGMRDAIQDKIDNLNKPKGSLGRLEELAMQICLAQQTLTPSLAHPCHLLFGADHGIEREGVSPSPREITWQQMINFTHGKGGVNMLCRQHGFELKIVDVGVDYDLSHYADIINRKVAWGTADFLHTAAMSEAQYEEALRAGADMARQCEEEGSRVIAVGEMGVANTSAASVWMSLLADIPLEACVGAGSGLDNAGIRHKYEVLGQAIFNFLSGNSHELQPYHPSHAHPTPLAIIRHFGGFEMVAAMGAMLYAAEKRMMVLVDGFIMTACALAAKTLYPEVMPYMIFCHQGDESGHARLLRALEARPLLSLSLRLGEGTGALCAFPIVDSAVRMMNEMGSFSETHVTKFFQ